MARPTFYTTAIEPERAFLVGVDWRQSPWPVDRSLDELAQLAETAGAVVVGRMTQRLENPVPRTFIGSGKVQELIAMVRNLDVDTVIFDDELSPSQQSNLEKLLGEPIKIIDRTALILDIFGLHAKTRDGRLQVQLAQLQYLLPRLRGMWSHLAKEQTRGGIGSRFGQGESQLEVDRRLIRDRIATLRHELAALERRRDVQSKQRRSSLAYRIALAGYTNAGKSTLLNKLTGSSVLSEDKLFATLDPTTRFLSLPGGREATVTDTVGFIQKLPHTLIDAFKSTLSEVHSADLILKVVDASDPDWDVQLSAVDEVLEGIGSGNVPMVTVFNKVDLLDVLEAQSLHRSIPGSVSVSARTGSGVEELLARISDEAAAGDELVSVVIPYSKSALSTTVHRQGLVIAESFEGDGAHIVAKVSKRLAEELEPYAEDSHTGSASSNAAMSKG